MESLRRNSSMIAFVWWMLEVSLDGHPERKWWLKHVFTQPIYGEDFVLKELKIRNFLWTDAWFSWCDVWLVFASPLPLPSSNAKCSLLYMNWHNQEDCVRNVHINRVLFERSLLLHRFLKSNCNLSRLHISARYCKGRGGFLENISSRFLLALSILKT